LHLVSELFSSCLLDGNYTKFYRGGYITREYGSSLNVNSSWDAIQTETPPLLRHLGGDDVRDAFAVALGKAVARFFQRYYPESVDPNPTPASSGFSFKSIMSRLFCSTDS
jgi:hypothetical protein